MHPRWHLPLVRWHAFVAKWIHPSETHGTLLWAALIGCVGGVSAMAFREALQAMLWLFTRHTGSLEQVATQLLWWQRFVIPAGGGLLAGLVLHFGGRFSRGARSGDYMEAVALGSGVISVRQGLTKTLSSVLTVSSGGSIGREGAMVQLSATLASWFGRRWGLSTPRLRLLVACGAAAGLAAVYNVTLSSALFVAEVVLGSIAMESLGPLLLAALASSCVSRYLGGAEAYFTSPSFELVSAWELIPYLFLGLGIGAAAPAFVRLLRRSEDFFTWLVSPIGLRLAAGGLIVGALAIPFPEVWGNGRTMVNLVLHNPWPWGVLACILLCKVVATAATAGSGAVGGVFTPSMFTGAMLGFLFGKAVVSVWPGQTGGPQAYALVAMGGFLAATTRAPLMSILILFEMTLDYGVVLPLMLVAMTAYYTARRIDHDSIYSESLRRKQSRSTPADVSTLRVRDLMKTTVATVTENASFSEVARLFAAQPYRHLLVVTLQNHLRGVISLRDVEEHLQRKGANEWVTAADLMRTDIPVVTPETGLHEALDAFRRFDGERLPVVKDTLERVLIGYISKTDLLLTLAHGLKGGPH